MDAYAESGAKDNIKKFKKEDLVLESKNLSAACQTWDSRFGISLNLSQWERPARFGLHWIS